MALCVTLIYFVLCVTLLEPLSGFITERIYQTENDSTQNATASNILPSSLSSKPDLDLRESSARGGFRDLSESQKRDSPFSSESRSSNKFKDIITKSHGPNSHPTLDVESNGLEDTTMAQEIRSDFISGTVHDRIGDVTESQKLDSDPTLGITSTRDLDLDLDPISNGFTDVTKSQNVHSHGGVGLAYEGFKYIKPQYDSDPKPGTGSNTSTGVTESSKPNPHHQSDFSLDGFPHATKSPCHIVPEKSYVNCSSRGISVINPRWFPVNTTKITLDNNNISTLYNDTFRHLSYLLILNISSSNVSTIQVNALRGLSSLETLDLEHNNLPLNTSFPRGMFNNMSTLFNLFIAYNNKETKNIIYSCRTCPEDYTPSPYPYYTDIFDCLPNLRSLSIDTFPTLYLGPEFEKFPNLTRLVLFCGETRRVLNSSFEGLANVTLRHLEMREFVQKGILFEVGVFQYLRHLESLVVYQCQIGNNNIMKTLWPFEYRKLSALILHGTNYPHHYAPPRLVFEDGIIHKNTTTHLRRICAAHFAWRDSRLYAIEPGAVDSPIMLQCIVIADFSSNPLELSGWQSLIYVASRFKRLRYIVLLMPKITPKHPNSNDLLESSSSSDLDLRTALTSEDLSSDSNVNRTGYNNRSSSYLSLQDIFQSAEDDHTNISIGSDFISKGNLRFDIVPHNGDVKSNNHISYREGYQNDSLRNPNENINDYNAFEDTHALNSDGFHVNDYLYDLPRIGNELSTLSYNSSLHYETTASDFTRNYVHQHWTEILPLITIRLPPQLQVIDMDSFNNHNFLHMIHTIYIVNGENFLAMYARYMPMFIYGARRLIGAYNMKLADVTGSLLEVADYFFDDFPGLESLILSDMKPDNFFQRIPCERLLRNLTHLRHLDISDNGLNFLSHDTFTSTPNLRYLNMAKNRFCSIPFDLSNTPKLEVLDLTNNAIRFLTEAEMDAIDAHVADGKFFTLKLQGNSFTCVCSRIRFLAWQQTTLAHFDNDGNYSCTSEDGQVAFTTDFWDILGFWRQCRGQFMFMVSLVLGSLLAVAMLTAYLTTRFRTAMVAYLLRIFAPHFRPMTISDYETAVFVGYADDDYRFVRYVLQRYLEDGVKVSTFIHQRDLGAGYKDQLFYEAIQNSWRILLVITDNFLHNYDMANIIMKYASYSVSPVNRERVLVLVEEAQLHNIPDFLYDVLDDTKIITLTAMNAPLAYHHKQAIKNCILPRP